MQSHPRIVSLLPSATEIVCILNAAEQLVGISHECDYPVEITKRRVLTSSRIDPTGSSSAIDQAVRRVIEDAISVYSVDSAGLADIHPDIVVTQDLCEVCAVSLDDVQAAVARLAQKEQVKIVSLCPTRLDDILQDIQKVAIALGRESTGHQVTQELRQRITRIGERSKTAPKRPRVVSLEWIDPLMIGGTWMPELIEFAGGHPAGASPGAPAPTVTPEQLRALGPEVVLIKPCGFSLARSLLERDTIEQKVHRYLPQEVPVYLTDGNAYFNRPGPRIVESLEIMAACVHPELFEDFRDKHAKVIHRL